MITACSISKILNFLLKNGQIFKIFPEKRTNFQKKFPIFSNFIWIDEL